MGTVDATIASTIASLSAEPDRTALLLDFDGSLAPIVAHPDDAVPLPGTPETLGAIAQHLALVGIVSGRPVAFLAGKLRAPDLALVGQYGLEWVRDGGIVVDERALPYVDAVAEAAAEAEQRWPDLFIERKGTVAVTVHWRTAPATDPSAVDQRVEEIDALARRVGLAVHPSRMARELRPPINVDKGTAVEKLTSGMSTVAFAGDDAGDLPAFAVIDRMRGDGKIERAVRIAVTSPEVPDEILRASDIVVAGPQGLRELLDALANALA